MYEADRANQPCGAAWTHLEQGIPISQSFKRNPLILLLLRSLSEVCQLQGQAQVSYPSSLQCHCLRCLSISCPFRVSGTSLPLDTLHPTIKQQRCWSPCGPHDVQGRIFILKSFWVHLKPLLRSVPRQPPWVTLVKKEIAPVISVMGLVCF